MAILKNKKIPIFLALMTAALVMFLYLDHIAVYFFAKSHNLNISYTDLKKTGSGGMIFDGLKVIDRKTGFGLFSKQAIVKAIGSRLLFKYDAIKVDLREVNFIKNKLEEQGVYDSLPVLVSMPFQSRWKYREISASIRPFKDGIDVKDFMASSDDMRLSFAGTIYNDNTVKSDVVIYFSDKLTGRIHEALSKVVLRDEADGWKSLSVSLTGDLKSPSVQVTGKLFRLNIKSVSEPN